MVTSIPTVSKRFSSYNQRGTAENPAVARSYEAPAQLRHELERARLTEQEFSRKLAQPFRQEADLHRLETEVADLKHRMETEGEPEPAAELVA